MPINLGVGTPKLAVVAIDLHRGHLDMDVATNVSDDSDDSVVVVEDCVDTMDGPDLHEAGLRCIRTAFGQVLRSPALTAPALTAE